MDNNFDLREYLKTHKLTKLSHRNTLEDDFISESLKLLREIKLDINNSVELESTYDGGKFKVGNVLYEYHIQKLPDGFMFPGDKDENIFEGKIFNVGFAVAGSDLDNINSFRPQDNQKNPIKVYSTMYKVILDLIETEHPDYLFIYSDDTANYHYLHKNLAKNNTPAGYVVQPTIEWMDGKNLQKTITLKKK